MTLPPWHKYAVQQVTIDIGTPKATPNIYQGRALDEDSRDALAVWTLLGLIRLKNLQFGETNADIPLYSVASPLASPFSKVPRANQIEI